MIKILSCILLAIMAFGPIARAQKHEGTLNGRVYTSKLIGWTMEVPEGCTIINEDSISENSDIPYSRKLKNLISFEKNFFNSFSADFMPISKTDTVNFEKKMNKLMSQEIYNGFVAKGIKVDTATGNEVIAGLNFCSLYNTIYYEAEVLARQIGYCRLINGYHVVIMIQYNNEADKKAMLDAFKNSKFTKK